MTLGDKYKELLQKKEKALVCYICGGDPDYETSKKIIKTTIENGADIVEIGIPFSDPMADGPTIQLAAERALKNNFSLRDAIKLVKELRDEKIETPFVFMSYYNPVYKYGLQEFVNDSKEAGVNGVIIPDLPPEEADELLEYTVKQDLDSIFLISPTMTEERLKRVTSKSSGFIYLVSLTGVTGARNEVNRDLEGLVKQIKEKTDLPVNIGFGVSKSEHVKEISRYSDGVIVGSAIVKIIENNLQNKEKMIKDLGNFVSQLKKGTRYE